MERWTGTLVGKMHLAKITCAELGREAQMSKSYVSMILNGSRCPPQAKERLYAAYDRIVERRKSERGAKA